MITFIVAIHVMVCFVLILVILLQAGRGSGLSWGSFGGSPQSFLGTKSASFLAKATSVSAILFLLTCITLDIVETRKSRSLFTNGPKNQKIDVEKIKKILEQTKKEPSKTSDSATTGAVLPNEAKNPAETQPTKAVLPAAPSTDTKTPANPS